jgi:hypothetical protein
MQEYIWLTSEHAVVRPLKMCLPLKKFECHFKKQTILPCGKSAKFTPPYSEPCLQLYFLFSPCPMPFILVLYPLCVLIVYAFDL